MWTRRLVELRTARAWPSRSVHDEPWMAFSGYLGDLRSRIAVKVTVPMPAIKLLILAIHERYPRHHPERCSKEHALAAVVHDAGIEFDVAHALAVRRALACRGAEVDAV